MKRKIDWRAFLIAASIICLLALLAAKYLGLSFWIVFCLLALGMFINGWIAYFEDKRLGGFDNPTSKDNPEK